MKAYIVSFLLVAALATSVTAADIKTAPAKPAASASANKFPKRYPYHANVSAIDLSAKTITLDGKKKQRVLYITPTTRILKDRKPVALETIKVGDYVTGSLVDSDGRLEPTTVNVGGTTPKPSAQAGVSHGASTPQQSASINAVRPGGSTARKP